VLTKHERRKALGDWYRDTTVPPRTLHKWNVKAPVRKTGANQETSGDQGGFLVPPELRVGMDAVIEEESFFHRHGSIETMSGVEKNVPSVDPTAATSGQSILSGGFTMYWTTEGEAPTASNVQLENIKLIARNLAGFGYVSNQLVADGGEPLGEYLEKIIARSTAFHITKSAFNADNTKVISFVGIINAPATQLVTRNTATSVVEVDIESMLKYLLPASFPYAWWCCSPGAFGQLTGLAGFFPAIELSADGVSVRAAGIFRGLPVFVTETLPQLGTKGDLLLIDPRMYVIGQRMEIEVAWTDQFPTAYVVNQSVVRAWWRGDGNVLWKSTGTAASALAGTSPMVCLV
jgi:HK97 family phage major capsid protein